MLTRRSRRDACPPSLYGVHSIYSSGGLKKRACSGELDVLFLCAAGVSDDSLRSVGGRPRHVSALRAEFDKGGLVLVV